MNGDALAERLDAGVVAREFSGVAFVWRKGAPLVEYASGIAPRGENRGRAESFWRASQETYPEGRNLGGMSGV